MELPTKLQDEIWDYCRVNKITNIDEFTIKLITQGFTIEKYGATPQVVERVVEKIVEVEKVVEVQVADKNASSELKKQVAKNNKTAEELKVALQGIEDLKKELAAEKKKKRDIYGE